MVPGPPRISGWEFIITDCGLRGHHGVRESFGLHDLVSRLGYDTELVKASESMSSLLSLAASRLGLDSWDVLGAGSGTRSCRLASLTRIVAQGSELSDS